MENVSIRNGGHQEMHEDLLPPLVASFDECVVRVVLISRIDSTQFPTQYHKNQFVGVPVLLLVGGHDSDSRAEKGLSASIVH